MDRMARQACKHTVANAVDQRSRSTKNYRLEKSQRDGVAKKQTANRAARGAGGTDRACIQTNE